MAFGGGRELQRTVSAQIVARQTAGPVFGQVGKAIQDMSKSANQSLKAFGLSLASSKIGGGLEDIGRKILDITKQAGIMSVDFEAGMANVRTQTDLTDASFAKLSDNTLDVMKRVPQAVGDIQEGLYDIFSSTDAGFEDATKMVEGFAQAATAGNTEIAVSGESVITMMNAYGLEATELQHILDLQFETVRKGVGNYEEFAGTLDQVVPSGRSAGQSLDELMGILAFASRQLGGFTEAAVPVARALDQLFRPDRAKDIYESLGIDVIDRATGAYRPFSDIITDMGIAMDGFTAPQRKQALAEIFGTGEIRAMRFFNVAIPNFRSMNEIVNDVAGNAGALDSAFSKMASTISVKFAILVNHLKAIGIELASNVIPSADKFLAMIDKLLDAFDKLTPETKELIAQAIALAGAYLFLTGKVIKLVGVFQGLKAIMLLTQGSMLTFSLIVLGAVAAVGIFIGAAVLVMRNWEQVGPFFIDLWERIKTAGQEAVAALQEWWSDHGEAILKIVMSIAEAIAVFLVSAFELLTSVVGPALSVLGELVDIVGPIIVAFAQLASALAKLLTPALQAVMPLLVSLGVAFLTITHGSALLMVILPKAIAAFKFLGVVLLNVKGYAVFAANSIKALGAALTSSNAIVFAVTMLIATLVDQFLKAKEAAAQFEDAVDTLTQQLLEDADAAEKFRDEWERTIKALKPGPALWEANDKNAAILAESLANANKELRAQKILLKDLPGGWNKTRAAIINQMVANENMAGAYEQLKKWIEETTTANEEAAETFAANRKAVDEYTNSVYSATGAVHGVIAAEELIPQTLDQSIIAFGKVVDGVSEFQKEHNKAETSLRKFASGIGESYDDIIAAAQGAAITSEDAWFEFVDETTAKWQEFHSAITSTFDFLTPALDEFMGKTKVNIDKVNEALTDTLEDIKTFGSDFNTVARVGKGDAQAFLEYIATQGPESFGLLHAAANAALTDPKGFDTFLGNFNEVDKRQQALADSITAKLIGSLDTLNDTLDLLGQILMGLPGFDDTNLPSLINAFNDADTAAFLATQRTAGFHRELDILPRNIDIDVEAHTAGAQAAINNLIYSNNGREVWVTVKATGATYLLSEGAIFAAASGFVGDARMAFIAGEGRYRTPMGTGAEIVSNKGVLPLSEGVINRIGDAVGERSIKKLSSIGGLGQGEIHLHFHEANPSPKDIVSELEWFSRTKGYGYLG